MSYSEASKTVSDREEETDDCFTYTFGAIQPYQDEPLASESGEYSSSSDEAEDEDGITPGELEARFEGTVSVDTWCKCGECKTELLVGPREYRCCKEVVPVVGKLTFEGRGDIICICQHPDYGPLTHKAVLLNVGPLLRGKDGKKYKRRGPSSQSENE